MKDRHERLLRMLAAVRQMKRMQQGRVRELEARRQALVERRVALLEALGSDAFRCSGLGEMIRRNLDETAGLEKRLAELKEQGRRDLRSRHMQEKRIERLKDKAGARRREEQEKAALLDVLDQVLRGS